MKLKEWLKNKTVKTVLEVLAVPIFGFILLNLAFMFDALFQGVLRFIVNIFIPMDQFMNIQWVPPMLHFSFLVIILFISWFIFRSKLSVLLKATYSVVPLATVFLTIGILFYPLQIVVLTLGGLFFLGVLYYLYKTKQPWLYYYALAFIGVLMLLVAITGVDI